MKTISIALSATVILVSSLLVNVKAQEINSGEISYITASISNEDISLFHPSPKEFTKTNQKALLQFGISFPDAVNAKWEYSKKGKSIARFVKNGIIYSVYYSKNGENEGVIKSYAEHYLDSKIENLVTDTYPEYTIHGVTEIEKNGTTIYIINLESRKFTRQIRIVDDSVEELFQFYNAAPVFDLYPHANQF